MSPRRGCIPDYTRRKSKKIADVDDSITVYWDQPRPCVIFEKYKFTMFAVSSNVSIVSLIRTDARTYYAVRRK